MNLAERIRNTVLEEHKRSKDLKFPMFPIKVGNKEIPQPHLMQRRVVQLLLDQKCIGNWSDMGTGKTLAGVLAAYSVKSKLTVICCPNSVKEEWQTHILGVFPKATILTDIYKVKIDPDQTTFLILNYEQFQQPWSKRAVDQLVKTYQVDLLIFDEIHLTKQRDENISKRRAVLLHFRTKAGKKNPNLYVIGQTGTPCINETMKEPTSQLELITGKDYSDLPTKRLSVSSVFRIRQSMMNVGIRQSRLDNNHIFDPNVDQINCSLRTEDVFDVRDSLLKIDRILLEEKIPSILKNIDHKSKVIIYLHYVHKLVTFLQDEIEAAGYKVDTYTGIDNAETRSQVKKNFIDGDTEVLIASSPISVGVDGLQKVCHKIILGILPWTAAEYKQLVCRLERQGQKNDVEVYIPQAFIELEGKHWSIDEIRWDRILNKRSISDMLVDGVIPDGSQVSIAQVQASALKWLDRVASGKIHDHPRQDIEIEFVGQDKERSNNFGELHQMHVRLNKMHSAKANDVMKEQEYFEKYHTLCDGLAKEWEVVPREVLASWCSDGDVIGDFGCGGKCHVAKLLPNNTVYSFDHNSLEDDGVICCDMSNVPLKDEQLDVVIFSLSLMGCNHKDYLTEAHRCLKKGGKVYIADLTARHTTKSLVPDLKEVGFGNIQETRKWKFTFLRGNKSEKSCKKLTEKDN